MQYNSYREKIKRIAAFLAKLYARLVIIIIATVAVLAAVTSVVAAKGAIISSGECPLQIYYGDALEYKANAFLGKVRYEYRAVGTEAWSESAPRDIGTYVVRAVSDSSFGNPRYGKEKQFDIVPRELVLSAEGDSMIYGDKPTVEADDLLDGDTVLCSFELTDPRAEHTEVWVDRESVKIENELGEDVTNNYTVTQTPKKLMFITPRDIEITVESRSKEYDAGVFGCTAYDISEGTLAEGDYLVCVFNSSMIDAGTQENVLKFRVSSEYGDMSAFYDMNVISGILNIDKRPLVITTDSYDIDYDGKPKRFENYSISQEDKSFLDSIAQRIEVLTSTEFCDVGTYPNTLEFGIFNSSGRDESSNYSIFIEEGTVQIDPRELTVPTGDKTHMYDDTQPKFVVPEDEIKGLAEGHTASVVLKADTRNAGTHEGLFDISIRDASGKDVSKNYEVKSSDFTVTITKRPITVELGNSDTLYLAEQPKVACENYSISEGELVSAHKVTITITCDDPTGKYEVGEYYSYSVGGVSIKNAVGEVSQNYDIKVNDGTLTIKPRPIYLGTQGATLTYDGLYHEFWELTVEQSSNKEAVAVGGHKFMLTAGEIFIDAGSYTNRAYEKDVVITSSDGQIIINPKNYSMSFSHYGTVKINKCLITVTADSKDWTYDGYAHSINTYTLSDAPQDVIDRHTVNATVSGSVTFVKDQTKNSVGSVSITRNSDGENALKNFDIKRVNGTIEIKPFAINIWAVASTVTYDGNSHGVYKYELNYDKSSIAPHEFDVSFESYINAGSYNIKVDEFNAVRTSDGAHVIGDNFTLTISGTITINPRPITVYSPERTFIYNGEPPTLTIDDYVASNMVAGHYAKMYITVPSEAPGVYTSELVKDGIEFRDEYKDGIPASNYKVTFVGARWEIIMPQTVEILLTNHQNKIYDGKPLEYVVSINSGGITGTATIRITDVSELYVKQLNDEHQRDIYVTFDFRDVYGNPIYSEDLSIVFNTYKGFEDIPILEVKPRPIHITAASETRVYSEGMGPLTNSNYTVSLGSLAEGHTVKVTISGSLTGVGEAKNEIKDVQFFDEYGNDVSVNYNCGKTDGTLEILPEEE